MVYGIQASLAFRNAARRDAVSSQIQTRLAATTKFGPVVRTDRTTMAGDPATTLEVRFTTLAEADSVWADLQAFVGTGLNGPIVGSYAARHNCPADQAPALCVEATRLTW